MVLAQSGNLVQSRCRLLGTRDSFANVVVANRALVHDSWSAIGSVQNYSKRLSKAENS